MSARQTIIGLLLALVAASLWTLRERNAERFAAKCAERGAILTLDEKACVDEDGRIFRAGSL